MLRWRRHGAGWWCIARRIGRLQAQIFPSRPVRFCLVPRMACRVRVLSWGKSGGLVCCLPPLFRNVPCDIVAYKHCGGISREALLLGGGGRGFIRNRLGWMSAAIDGRKGRPPSALMRVYSVLSSQPWTPAVAQDSISWTSGEADRFLARAPIIGATPAATRRVKLSIR